MIFFSLSYNGLKLQRNKWEFFMFLILEVSAMIITGVTAIISMFTFFCYTKTLIALRKLHLLFFLLQEV